MGKEDARWNLDDVLPIKKFDSLYREIEEKLKEYEFFYANVSPEMPDAGFKALIDFDEKMSEMLNRLTDMPLLMEAADQKSAEAKLMKSKSENLAIKHANISRKLGLWIQGKPVENIKTLDNSNAERLFNALPDLKYVLRHARESAKYTLNEREERICTEKNATGIDVVLSLRELIETEFKYRFKVKGKKERIIDIEAEVLKYAYSKNPAEREAASVALLTKFKENLDKFFMIYQAVVKDWHYSAEMRGFKSAIAIRNHANHVPDEAVEALLAVCRENRDVYQRYFKFKAKELGIKQLRRYDLYAPLNIAKTEEIPYAKGVKIVLDTYDNFAKSFGEKARVIINRKHIDSHPRLNKRGGAFCSTVAPSIAPYVMLNYTNRFRDVSTLAHELGHGIHSLYSNKHSISCHHANLPLSETASTLGEMIVFEKLLEMAKNDREKKAMLADKMADSYATIMRQAYFVEFEIAAHNELIKGITAEQLSDIYFSTLKEQFGNSVSLDPLYRYEWSRIPHIFESPFYCYAYNFGELLSLALFARYKKEGSSFVPKVEKVLAYGGSENPDKVLKEIGVDMSSKKFWQGSFEIVKEWQMKLEKY
ncbi:MAG: M3 family oligoendopeptidase [Candidatus Nanoarchaeia archaeon]|nr:M3 family oligoendopeptidase [Candidatus Nanoarchaeia archaeon]